MSTDNTNNIKAVDLGLSVKWASQNIKSANDSSKDAYFAWGCTKEQDKYTTDSYPYYKQDISDGTGNLPLEKDAAAQNWGGKWRTPTINEWNELINNCVWTEVTIDGVSGYNVTGNGNTIFIPMSGMISGNELHFENTQGEYWTSECKMSDENHFLDAYGTTITNVSIPFQFVSGNNDRYAGFTVRPVYDEDITPVNPDHTGQDDTDTSNISSYVVDLGLSVKWAKWNIGATSENEVGYYIAWGDPTGKNGSYVNSDYPNPSSGDIAGTEYDTATILWGEGWKMPTAAEWAELDNLTKELVTLDNGMKVFKVIASNGNYIYLPRGGYKVAKGLQEYNVSADYWTSENTSQTFAKGVRLGKVSSTFEPEDQKGWHMLVRPVYKKSGSTDNSFPLTDEGKAATAIDLGLSVKWATYNLGTKSSTDPGAFFAWAETTPRATFSNFSDVDFSKNSYKWYDASTEKYNIPSTNISYTSNDAASKLWGGTWRMPTETEMWELKNKCTWTKTDTGFRVTGPNGNEIFLPFTGFFSGNSFSYGEKLHYWSASYNDLPLHAEDYWAYYLTNYTSGSETLPTVLSTYIYNGLCIRPVSGGDVEPTPDPTPEPDPTPTPTPTPDPDTDDDNDDSFDGESRQKLINEYSIAFKSNHYKKYVFDFSKPWDLFNTQSEEAFMSHKDDQSFLKKNADFSNTNFDSIFSFNYWKGDTQYMWSDYLKAFFLNFAAGAGFKVRADITNGNYISAIDFGTKYTQVDLKKEKVGNAGMGSGIFSTYKSLWVCGSYVQPGVNFYYRTPGFFDFNGLSKVTLYGSNIDEVPDPGSKADYGRYDYIQAKGYREAMFNFLRPHTLSLFADTPDEDVSYAIIQDKTFKNGVVSVSFGCNPTLQVGKISAQIDTADVNPTPFSEAGLTPHAASVGYGGMFTISVEQGYEIESIVFEEGLGGFALLIDGKTIYNNAAVRDTSLPICAIDQDRVVWVANKKGLTSVDFVQDLSELARNVHAIYVGYVKEGETITPPTPSLPDSNEGTSDAKGDTKDIDDDDDDNIPVSSKTLTFTDTYDSGYSIDPNVILYAGGQEVIPKTMTQKDNTLFLGNYKQSSMVLSQETLDLIKANCNIEYTYFDDDDSISKGIFKGEIGGLYMYENQLSKNSYEIASFKGGEVYRFGLVFQNRRGEWSEAVYVGDKVNTSYPQDNGSTFLAPKAKITMTSSIVDKLYGMGYRKVKTVVVYPSINNRLTVCQGVLCPTVYSMKNRIDNSPYTMSSWFFREMHSSNYTESGTQNSHSTCIYNDIPSYLSLTDRVFATPTLNNSSKVKNISQFRAEISCASVNPYYAYCSTNSKDMYVDWNTVTMNTPEVDFSLQDTASTVPTENLKLRIIGIIPLTSNASDVIASISTQPVKKVEATFQGLHNINDNNNNISYEGSKLRLTKFDWYDYSYFQDKDGNHDWNTDKQYFDSADDLVNSITLPNRQTYTYNDKIYKDHRAYPLYPWQGAKSLVGQFKVAVNNTSGQETKDSGGIIYDALKYKRVSNIRTSAFTYYFPTKALSYDIGNVGLYSGDIPLAKLDSDSNDVDHAGMFNYYGEMDTIIAPTEYYEFYNGLIYYTTSNNNSVGKLKDIARVTPIGKTNDTVRIKYKSSPHLVCHLNYTKDGKQELLPSFTLRGYLFGDQTEKDLNIFGDATTAGKHYIPGWSDRVLDKTSSLPNYSTTTNLHQSNINLSYPIFPFFEVTDYERMGFMYIGEFYKDAPLDLSLVFGGTTPLALEKNQWHTAGPSVELVKGSSLTVKCLQGDTYYQRYDSLKTYPYTTEDPNQIVEILSFMCETRMNIDGRYDHNRGMSSNLYINNVNFNLFNPVYTQQDNFFNYYFLDPERNEEDAYPNGFVWTKSKTMGEEIDTWSSLNTSSSYNLDGDKGDLYALINWNDTLMSFQENGIARILYNDRVQIATNDGTPIEIANSTKVSGKQYMSTTVGCSNKRTIQITPKGVYFMDNNSKDLYIIGNGIDSLSKAKGFNSYFYNKDISKYRTFYDEKLSDIYFLDDIESLVFNEPLNEFEGFYDYGGTDFMFNYKDSFISVKDNSLWKQFAGDYNMFYGKYKPFWLTLISNDGNNDKTFSNIEFEADSWHSDNTLADSTFDHLSIWDEYQMGESILRTLNTNVHYHFSNLKRKFRVWRANIPRDIKLKNITFPEALKKMQAGEINENTGKILNMTESLNRIRNTWAYIRLKKYKENTDKTILHGIKTSFIV